MTIGRLAVDVIIATTVAATVVGLAAAAARRAPAVLRHSLWRMALLAFLLVPIAAGAADGLRLQVAPFRLPAVAAADRLDILGRIGGRYGDEAPAAASAPEKVTASAARDASVREARFPSLPVVGAWLWALGAAVSAVSLLQRMHGLRKLLHQSSPISGADVTARIRSLSQHLGLRRAPVVVGSGDIGVPTVAGCRSPVLLLPRGFSIDDPGSDAVVVHELAHIARRDLLAQAAARIARVLWWWHPLCWLADRRLSTTAEEACDDWAVSLTATPESYADHIVRWAENAHATGMLACSCRGRELTRRVHRVLTRGAPRRLRSSARVQAALVFCAMAVVLGAAVLRAQPAGAGPQTHKEGSTMTVGAEEKLTYGFRHDPLKFVENDRSLQGACVRTFVFEQPKDGDAAIIQTQVDEILAEQREDGSFGDTSKETGQRLLRLLQLGFPPGRPEVARGVEALLRQKRSGQNANEWVEKEGALSIYALHALCLLGRSDIPEVVFSLKWYVEHPEEWNGPWEGCPWTPEVFWSALWDGRDIVDTTSTIAEGMRRVADSMNAAGCAAYNDPYGFVDAAGQIDLPEARALVEKQIPMLLRGQRPDGGWRDNSLFVFRALRTHGYFDTLRDLPPLPPDWEIVRSIPAPGGDLWTMTWDGERLWVYHREKNSAVAVSSSNGEVLKTLELPVDNVVAIGWWDDCLAVTQSDPKKLLKVDAATGEIKQDITIDETDWTWVGAANQVNGKIWVVDEFSPGIIVIDPASPDERELKPASPDERELKILAGPGPNCFAPTPDGVWHADFWAHTTIKTSYDGKLLDWGDQVFERGTAGLAFDGENLWALDGANRRICVIAKTETGAGEN